MLPLGDEISRVACARAHVMESDKTNSSNSFCIAPAVGVRTIAMYVINVPRRKFRKTKNHRHGILFCNNNYYK